jgi:hypothetical protein
MYERISNENLDIMRQRLLETVVWPTDDTTTSEAKDWRRHHNKLGWNWIVLSNDHGCFSFKRWVRLRHSTMSMTAFPSCSQSCMNKTVDVWFLGVYGLV